jgi:hypothetical protein
MIDLLFWQNLLKNSGKQAFLGGDPLFTEKS